MEGGAVAGSAAAVRVGSWDAITKAVPSWMVSASSAGKPLPGGQCQAAGSAPPVVTAWSGCGTGGHGCAAAAGGRSRVGREILLCRCCDRPCFGAPGSLEEVNDAVLVAGGTLPVALLRGLPADPGCG